MRDGMMRNSVTMMRNPMVRNTFNVMRNPMMNDTSTIMRNTVTMMRIVMMRNQVTPEMRCSPLDMFEIKKSPHTRVKVNIVADMPVDHSKCTQEKSRSYEKVFA